MNFSSPAIVFPISLITGIKIITIAAKNMNVGKYENNNIKIQFNSPTQLYAVENPNEYLIVSKNPENVLKLMPCWTVAGVLYACIPTSWTVRHESPNETDAEVLR